MMKNGWVVIFVVICLGLYLHGMSRKEAEYQEMVIRLKELEKEKERALTYSDDLAIQIKSQSDPAWVEMVLKRNLGLVPEGQTKVYFHNQK